MAHNSSHDTFAVGNAEGNLVKMTPVKEMLKRNSGDGPGRVASVLPEKRQSPGHEAQVAEVKESGIVRPLTTYPDGTLVDGHHRLAAAIDAGLTHVPVRSTTKTLGAYASQHSPR